MPIRPRCAGAGALRALALGFALLLAALPARADLVDTVLGIVAPDYLEYKTVISCIVDKGTLDDTVAKACVAQAGKEQGKQLVASDPKLKSIVDTVLAANAGQWVRVLEIVGTDGLKTVVCSGAVGVGGAVTSLVCGSAFQVAKPVIKSALQAVIGGDWWALISLLGPQSACAVIPGGEAKDILCGTLAQVLNEVGKFAAGGVNAAKDALIDFGEVISGQTQHMPPDKYYQMYWYPNVHIDVRVILNGGQPSYKVKFEHCVDYFDSHKASKESGEKWCGKMRDQLAQHVKAIVPAIKAAPDAYFVGKLKSQVARIAIEHYHAAATEPYKTLRASCLSQLPNTVPIPGKVPTQYDSGPPYSAYAWACDRAMAETAKAVAAYRSTGVVALLATLGSSGCKSQTLSNSAKLYTVCDSFEGYGSCQAEFNALQLKGAEHCGVDGNVAAPKLAKKIAAKLGAKRCAVSAKVSRTVECTRPWKTSLCEALAKKYHGAGWNGVICATKNDPAFLAAQTEAQGILDTLNGVKKAGTVQKPGGKPQGLVVVPPGKKPCSHGFDPLAINCLGYPDALSQANVSLPGCAADPNKDGSDIVCYAGLSPYGKPAAAAAATKPVAVPSGPDLTAQAGPWLLRRSGKDDVQWGGKATVKDTLAMGAQDGKCYFGLHFILVNAGSAPSGPFEFSLAADGEAPSKRRSGPLAAGATGSHDLFAYLRPGVNTLRLSIDSAKQVPEGDEGNNVLAVTVTVEGTCHARGASADPATKRNIPIRPPAPEVSRERSVPSR